MMAEYMCMDTLKFLLFDVHKVDDLLKYERFADFNKESFDLLLDSAKSWADQDFYPYYKEMDEKPVYYKDGKVYSHPILKKIFKDAGDNGWLGMYFDQADGGIQLPHSLANATNHIIEAANNHIPGYLGLTSGAAHLIASFGTQSLKDTYIPPMLSGKWSGTMALTEPQCGSSLSDIVTSAKPNSDGSYRINGQKIFISGGDHEATDNFVHLTLARIEGAPSGTKGISLFVVPKYRPEADGNLTYNDVQAVSDFQKMGQRGYSTVHLVYGEQGDCHGYLVGEQNMGLKYMFQMMNGARIDVGMTAASTAIAAYYASLQYAKERPQGRKILNTGKKDPSEGQTLIINHPDVRRMLLLQKAITEGSLSLLLECSLYSDLAHVEEGEAKQEYHELLELLTPIAKTYPSEMGRVSINNGLQVLGGYGYCMDFPLQQYLRDIRIMSIYEGTTGIQSLDLLGRKVTHNNGRALQFLTQKIMQTIESAGNYNSLKPYADQLQKRLGEVQKALEYLIPYAMKGDFENFLADATIFMEMTSNVVVGYQWLKMATTAEECLSGETMSYEKSFYESKIHTMKFYFKYELPKVRACLDTLLSSDKLTLQDDLKTDFF
ncbi:MAG: acyl-CoA dehydrogenase [Saprospiraceae bacterium]|nr:acyl-CoA dehydrogenase [Saprospiraceae bacterium]